DGVPADRRGVRSRGGHMDADQHRRERPFGAQGARRRLDGQPDDRLGGVEADSFSFTGGRYDPASDAWQTMELGTDPGSRENFTAVWTGTEMLVWGGDAGSIYLDTGGRYDPSSDHWSFMGPLNRAPQARAYAKSVWTGSEMIVWGGYNGS